MTKAVIYARYSSHNQREESIEGQIRKCKAFAEQNGLTVIGEYVDRAISGKTDKRDDFQRMIRDSESGHFEAIIMYTLDRFARNRYDSAHYKAKLKKNGIHIYYTEQSISDEPEGIILESVLEGMAEYYSENLSRGVKRGMRENALKCMITGGYMPLGYRKTPDKKYEINPATAPIVREMFDLYLHGKSQRQVAEALNEKGYRTVKDKPFKLGSIECALTNRKYIGYYSFGDVEIENGIPAIIDKDVFEKVQEMLKKNKRESGRMKAPMLYLLTGKIFCGECGSPMRGECGTSQTGAIYNYYKCADRKSNGSCNKGAEKKEWIEDLIVNETIKRVLQPGVIAEIAAKVAEMAEKEFNDNSRIDCLSNELNAVQTSIRNLLRLVEQGINTDDIGERLIDLNGQKADLQKQISKEENRRQPISKERIEFWLTDLLTHIEDTPDYKQRIIDTLVNKVFVFDGDNGGKKIVVMCNSTTLQKYTVELSDVRPYVKSSDINGFAPPLPTIPNFFIIKYCFGFVIEIESAS